MTQDTIECHTCLKLVIISDDGEPTRCDCGATFDIIEWGNTMTLPDGQIRYSVQKLNGVRLLHARHD